MCRDCKRQIEIVRQDDGSVVQLDTEVRRGVAWPGGLEVITIRLLHGGLCTGAPPPITARRRRAEAAAAGRKVRQ